MKLDYYKTVDKETAPLVIAPDGTVYHTDDFKDYLNESTNYRQLPNTITDYDNWIVGLVLEREWDEEKTVVYLDIRECRFCKRREKPLLLT